ncbi:MAG: SDR family NAD(P)-dependent oxidoreductase, partial [Pseudomonadota bacterium]
MLQPRLDYDIRGLWLPDEAGRAAADERLKTPSVQLPLIMIVEYALAKLLSSWGVEPAKLIGHSMGENTAAAVAGVMSFEDCIGLVHLRGQLFDTVAPGGMLSVTLPAEDLRPLLGDTLDLGAVNGPNLSVASGPEEALEALQATLDAREIEYQRIAINIAAHSRMLDPILEQFGAYLRSIQLNPPQVPILSNHTGQELTAEQATDPDYWVQHLRGTVHFASGVDALAADGTKVFIEVGPGKALSSLAGQNTHVQADQVINTLRHPEQDVADDSYFMAVLGRLWAVGLQIDWAQIWGEAARNRLVLPGYQFQRSHYYIALAGDAPQAAIPSRLMREENLDNWGYAPRWRKAYADCPFDVSSGDLGPPETWLIFKDDAGVAAPVIERLRAAGHAVAEVVPGDAFAQISADRFALAPEQGRDGYDQLIQTLVAQGRSPTRIAMFWPVTRDESFRPGSSFFHRTQEQGFYALMFLSQAISAEALPVPLHISVFSTGAQSVRGETLRYPEKATLSGPVRVIPAEMPGVTVSWCDVQIDKVSAVHGWFAAKGASDAGDPTAAVFEEILATPESQVSALRKGTRFVHSVDAAPLGAGLQEWDPGEAPVVLITGGLGGIGLTLAADLIRNNDARIVLMSRRRIAADDPRLAGFGSSAICLQGDVSNAEDMRRIRREAEARFGAITGVIHAAGVIDDAPILSKGAGSVEAVFTPKIHGTQVLGDVFPDGDLAWKVLFSSSSTVTAPAGQIDYVAANSYLNAFAEARRGGRTKVIALGWGVWSEVGMAADAMASRLGVETQAPPVQTGYPLASELVTRRDGTHVFETDLSAAQHWVLSEHRTKDGVILMPGTGYLEIVRQCLRGLGIGTGFALHDLYFLRPLDVGETETRRMRVALVPTDAGFDMRVQSALQVQGRDAWQTHAEAAISLAPMERPDPLDLTALASALPAPKLAAQGATLISPQEAHLDFGPR